MHSADSPERDLVRGIGVFGSALLVLNGLVGAGIFALPPIVAARAGALGPWLFLGAGFLFIAVVLTFAELSGFFRKSGGPVLYATVAFGPLIGFSTGWIYYISRAGALAANSHIMATYLAALVPWFGTNIGRAVVIVAVLGGLTAVNAVGVRDSIRALTLFTLLKVLPLLALILLGFAHLSPNTFFPASLPTIDDLGGTVLLLMYPFIGFESALVTAGETKRPRETIPKTLILTVIATGVFYFLIMLVYNAVLPGATDPDATLVDVGRVLAGPVGAVVITLAAVFSIGGNLSGTMLAGPRLTFALAEQRLLPDWFSEVNPRYSSPANSVVFLGGLALILALSGSFVLLAVATSLTRLIAYSVCIAALPVVKQKAAVEAEAGEFRLPGGYTIPVLAFLLCLWVISHSPLDSWLITGGLLIVGLIPYFLTQRRMKSTGMT